MPALSPRTMPRPASAPVRLRAPLVVLGLLLAGCGGAAMADKQAEPPPPPNDETHTFTGSPAPTALASADAAPSFMRVGEVARETMTPPVATATAAAEPPKPIVPLSDKKGTKALASKPQPTGTVPPADGGGGGHKPDTDAAPANPKAPEAGVHAAVVDSASNLSEAEVRSTIVQKQASFRECYDLGASGSAGAFSGSITLRVSIGPTGTVASVDVVASTTKVAAVDSCVTQAVRKIQFPAKGNGAVVAFPIEFGK